MTEEPPCEQCLPELQKENGAIYEVYARVFNATTAEPFKIMKLIGIKKNDELMCLDFINSAKNAVTEHQAKTGKQVGEND